MARRPEETERFRQLMQQSVKEGGYEDEFRISSTARRDTQDVHVVIETAQGEVTDGATRRTNDTEERNMSVEHIGGYIALAGLLIAGGILAWHGVAIGGGIHLLHIINHYGLTQEALQAVSGDSAAGEVIAGMGISLGSLLGISITSNLDTE